ncbi:MAG TPA: hybrid sensor histidine kinase/response regulator, partial [Albitalea sp.]|nr:hybrid sensor histidine kinase/response regulator [Albitalea sp.]
PGFPQTLRGGPAWRDFLAACSGVPELAGEVDLPQGALRPALAIARPGIVAVLLGGRLRHGERRHLDSALPLLARMLQCEHRIVLAGAEAADARESANRAHALSAALEAARAEHARLNAQLRDEHRRKDEFLAMLAHELRNPLSPLLTSLEILRHRAVGVDVRERQIEVMARQVAQLTRLIEDLLDVSRVSRGRIELQCRPMPLRRVIDDALETCAPLLQARRHRVHVSMEDPSLTVNADAVRMSQVFANLLNNAAKYTEPRGRIVLVGQRDGDDAVVRIEDNGIGIAPTVLPFIFDLFAQGPVTTERSQGGLGIGLTLVRTLLELHRGSVTAHSAGLGQGSTFVVRLPLAAMPAASGETRAAAPPAADLPPLSVLVVDDNHDAADSLATVLRLLGHHAEVAYGAAKAIQLAADLDPDLVLLDIGLPDMDGHEVARRLRRVAKRTARLVALTGYGSDDDRRRTGEAGFDEHVVKPVDPQALAELLERAAARSATATGATPIVERLRPAYTASGSQPPRGTGRGHLRRPR